MTGCQTGMERRKRKRRTLQASKHLLLETQVMPRRGKRTRSPDLILHQFDQEQVETLSSKIILMMMILMTVTRERRVYQVP